MDLPEKLPEQAQCPAARVVQGATPAQCGVVCSVMEADSKRADPILEGAPIGVFISAKDDPTTLAAFCFGTAQPQPDPDVVVAHYTSCPVWAAGREIEGAQRAFAMERVKPAAVPGVGPEPDTLTQDEIEFRG